MKKQIEVYEGIANYPDKWSNNENLCIDDDDIETVLSYLDGKKVRITIEVLE